MNRLTPKKFLITAFLSALTAPVLFNCGSLPKVPGAPALPDTSCPDFSSADAVAKVDFANEFKLKADVGSKLKAGVQASEEIQEFSAKLDADLKDACGGLAKDLGDKGDYKNGQDACKAAIKVMGDVKAKIGANAKITLDVIPPRCDASMDVMADCAGKCDASVTPGSAKVECEPGKLSGSCDAQCSGTCDLSASAKCDGTCEGSCDATFKGSCGGNCDGKCDGKSSKGAVCNGTCDGKCDAKASGTCGGKCGGSCKMKAAAKCDGTCTGSCSAEMKAPKCSGEVTPPKMSGECKAHCDAKVNSKLECKPASVTLRIEGAADATAAATYKGAIEKNLPGVLKIAIGMAKQSTEVAANIEAVIGGLQAGITGIAQGSSDKFAAAKLGGCIAAPFKGAIDAAASVKANVNVSVDVKASASGSAGGAAGGKAG
ncbi:MAG: hypothetical protein ABI461_04390 [Polyangiaceae bacterium]